MHVTRADNVGILQLVVPDLSLLLLHKRDLIC
jgi:hypothetical protein